VTLVGVVIATGIILAHVHKTTHLDLVGGTRAVLHMQKDPTGRIQIDADTQQQLVAAMSRRINNLGIAEPVIQAKGTHEIVVEMPQTPGKTAEQRQAEMFAPENTERIERQKQAPIFVALGNPPYNLGHESENDNNKNRTYPRVDERIKATYIKESTAQKTKLYDMYARFFRWASDRIKDEGIIAFVSNRSFIDSRPFDGFRKIVARDFNEIWVVDLGGDWKRKDFAGGGNVFGIGTGVAISFLVKRKETSQPPHIFYAQRPEREAADDKLSFLSTMRLSTLDMIE